MKKRDYVSVPRERYDRLVRNESIMEVLRITYTTIGRYAMGDLLETIFSSEGSTEKEDA